MTREENIKQRILGNIAPHSQCYSDMKCVTDSAENCCLDFVTERVKHRKAGEWARLPSAVRNPEPALLPKENRLGKERKRAESTKGRKSSLATL